MDVDVKVEPSEMTDEQEFLLFDVLENGEEMETIDFDDVTEVPTSSKEDSQPPTGLKVVAPRGGHKATCNGYAMDSLYTNSEGLLFWRCSKYATLGCPGSALSEELDGALVERQRHNHPAKDPRPKKTKAKKKHSRMKVPTKRKNASMGLSKGKGTKRCAGHLSMCNGYEMQSEYMNQHGAVGWTCAEYATRGCMARAFSKGLHGELLERKSHNHIPGQMPENENAVLDMMESAHELSGNETVEASSVSARHIHQSKQPRRWRTSLCNGYAMRVQRVLLIGIRWQCMQKALFKCSGWATSDLDGADLTQQGPHNHVPLSAALKIKKLALMTPACRKRRATAPLKPHEKRPPAKTKSKRKPTAKSSRHLLRCDAYKEVDGYFMRCASAAHSGMVHWVCRQRKGFKCNGSATSDLDGEQFTMRRPHNHDPAPLKVHQRGANGGALKWDRQLLRCDVYKEVDSYFMRCSTASSNGKAYWICRQMGSFKCKASAISDLDGREFTMRQPHNHDPAPLRQCGGGGETTTYDRNMLRCDVNKEVDGYFMRCSTASSNGVAYWVCRQATGFKCKASASSDLDGNEFTMRQPHNHDPAPLAQRSGGGTTTWDRQLLRCDACKEIDGYFMRCSTASSNGVAYWGCRQATGFKCKASASSDLDGKEFTMRQPHNHDPAPLVRRGGGEAATYDRNLLRCDVNKEVDGYFMRCSTASSNDVGYWVCRQKGSFNCNASATSDLDGNEFSMRQPHNHDPAPLAQRGGGEAITRDRNLLRCDVHKEIDGYFMRCSTASSNGVAYWGCRQRTGFDCSASATSDLDGQEFTMRQPHNHDPAPLGPRAGGGTITRDRNLLRCDAHKEIDGYFMRCSTASSNGVAYWGCRQRDSFDCNASATSDLDGQEFIMRQPHTHDPAPLGRRRGRKPREETLPAWCITERRNLRSDMDAEGDPGSSSNAKHYADDSDDSERSASPARPKKIRALARKVVEKTPVSPFYGKCRGRMALCEGYHMRSVYVTKKGLLYWKCAKQTTFKCPGSAMSDPNGGELVESQAHNHEPVPLYKWTKKLLSSDKASSEGDVKPMSVRKAGRPREDKKWESKNLHLLHCDVFATVDGYLMRCMNVSVGTGMSYWYCRLCMRFKCRGSATSDLYGKDFMPVQPHNHPPEGMMRKSSSQLSSFGSSTMKWFKDISDDDEPSSSYKSQTVKTEKHEGAIGVGTTSKDDDEFDKLVAASAGFDDFYIDLTQDDALAECDL